MDSIRLCSVDGCALPRKSRGWCSTHYERWRRNGDPLVARVYRVDSCSVEGCERAHEYRGFCSMHAQRLRKSGTTTDPVPRAADDHHLWRGRSIGYTAAHMRVRSARGPAKHQMCRHCGRAASDWAYSHDDPDALVSEQGEYSANPAFYLPLCRSCHVLFDRTS